MIYTLRNRLFGTVMGFITVLLFLAFLSIYLVSYARIQNDNQTRITSKQTTEITYDGKLVVEDAAGIDITTAAIVRQIAPEIGIYFDLIVNDAGELIYINSALNLRQEVYDFAASIAKDNPLGGLVDMEDRKWMYRATPEALPVLEGVNAANGAFTHMRFLDITDSHQMLSSLMLTLMGLYAALLFVFAALAWFFANRSIRPMAEAWESQRQFIADASHELKTPISTLNANLDVLYASQEETIQSQIRWLDNSKKVLLRMTTLIRDMLELAQVEEHDGDSKMAVVDIRLLLDEVIDCFAPAADEKDIAMYETMEGVLQIHSNHALVQQVLEILIDNAIRHADENGKIAIEASLHKSEVFVKVMNTGKGIAPEDLGKVFDRFYRGDKARTNQGAHYGLGLSIARSAMQRLGGSISVNSNAEWTIFTAVFPNRKLQGFRHT